MTAGASRVDPGQRHGQLCLHAATKAVTEAQNNDQAADTVTPAESFTYQVTDDNGNTTTGTINIAIVDDTPTAVVDGNNVTEGSLLTVVAGDGVLHNDDVRARSGYCGGWRCCRGSDAGRRRRSDGGGDNGRRHGHRRGGTAHCISRPTAATPINRLPTTSPSNATDAFVYTVKDGDGDLSTTTLTIKSGRRDARCTAGQ